MEEMKPKANMFKINEPIGRICFLTNWFIIMVIHIFFRVTTHYFKIFAHGNNTLIISILAYSLISALFVYYLHFINTAKRFWDISQNKMFGIIMTSIYPILFIVSIPILKDRALIFIPATMLLLTIYLSVRGKRLN